MPKISLGKRASKLLGKRPCVWREGVASRRQFFCKEIPAGHLRTYNAISFFFVAFESRLRLACFSFIKPHFLHFLDVTWSAHRQSLSIVFLYFFELRVAL
jgi:hypothetical protein